MPNRQQRPAEVFPQKKNSQWKLWVLGVVIVLFLIIVIQNAQKVQFKLLFMVDTEAPLVLLLLIAAAIGAAIGYTAPIMRRHRHQTRKDYGKD